jgi:hypothetical protein
MINLTEQREITPYRWVHPDEERCSYSFIASPVPPLHALFGSSGLQVFSSERGSLAVATIVSIQGQDVSNIDTLDIAHPPLRLILVSNVLR